MKFIFNNGGEALESELRKKFLQPRTTMWRAVKRLEREGVIEIEKKDLQNLVKLRKNMEEEAMKKFALFAIIVLIFGTISPSLVNHAYGQNDPSILLRIAIQADKQIVNQLNGVYGDQIPNNIQNFI